MPRAKITKTFVDKAPYSEKGQVIYCDTELAGFYLIVGKRSKTYVAQKDINGRSIRCNIGRHGHFTAEEARQLAKNKLYLLAQGVNPNKTEEKQPVTLELVLKSYQETRKNINASTKDNYEYLLRKYLADWMHKLIVDIDKSMIITRHNQIGNVNGPYTANGVMRILRAMFNHAYVTYDICETNPVTYLSKTKAWYPDKRRRTYIKPHQLKAWWNAVQALENDTIRDFLIFLLFTGLRRGEASSLKWRDIDFNDKTFTIQATKNGDPLTLPLGTYVSDMFQKRRRRYGNYEYVFPGSGKDGYLSEPKKGIYKVVQKTGIQFTCHDLRRTFITIAESLELSTYAVKKLVNHRVHDVTSGYIIFNAERLRTPVKRIEEFILEQVNG